MLTDANTSLLTIDEAAQALGVSSWTVRRRVQAGEIPAVKLGEHRNAPIRIDPRELSAWVFGPSSDRKPM
jgi:excisionase family DNA binding protein